MLTMNVNKYTVKLKGTEEEKNHVHEILKAEKIFYTHDEKYISFHVTDLPLVMTSLCEDFSNNINIVSEKEFFAK